VFSFLRGKSLSRLVLLESASLLRMTIGLSSFRDISRERSINAVRTGAECPGLNSSPWTRIVLAPVLLSFPRSGEVNSR
jgi:hypothetical protein